MISLTEILWTYMRRPEDVCPGCLLNVHVQFALCVQGLISCYITSCLKRRHQVSFNCTIHFWCGPFPANIYLFKVNNRNTRKRCEIKVNNKNTTDVPLVWGIAAIILCQLSTAIVSEWLRIHTFLKFWLQNSKYN